MDIVEDTNIRIVLLVCSCMYTLAQPPPEDVQVTISYGTVRGKQISLDDGTVIDTYMGIPYAKPPVGELRFSLPQEPDPWEDVFDATTAGDACVQDWWYTQYSEDCLHLNVYTAQKLNPNQLYPVMVYIHGGDYGIGANFDYPGYFLAREGVVVVALNYRLGILGFGYTGDGIVPGNMGLMDLILGLEFVQKNIEVFGGDPNQVTIFGQSAGGSASGQLMFSPFSAGLFHGAILQSGCEMAIWPTHWPDYHPENFIVDVASKVGCPTLVSEAMVECLRGVDADTLITTGYTCPPGYQCWGFRPVIDGVIIPDTYENLRAQGWYMKVPEINGYNENDAFTDINVGDIPQNGLSRAEYNIYLWNRANQTSQKWDDPTRREDVFEAFKFMYSDWPYYDDPYKNRAMLGKLYTDEWYGYPADVQSKLHSTDGNDVFYYVYDYVPQYVRDWGPDVSWQGAYHGLELDFVFGWPQLLMPENKEAYDHSGLYWDEDYTAEDFEYADFMMTMWTNFAKFGDPTPTPLIGPNNTLISWTPFSGNTTYLNMRPRPEVKIDYRQSYYAYWAEYLDYLINGEDLRKFSEIQGEIMDCQRDEMEKEIKRKPAKMRNLQIEKQKEDMAGE